MRENMKGYQGACLAQLILLRNRHAAVSGSVRQRSNGLRLVNGGRDETKMLPEHAAEVRGTREAPRKCDIRDRLSALGLQLLATMQQPCAPDVIADGHALVA